MNTRIIIRSLIMLLLPFVAVGQESAIDSLALYHAATAENSGKIQQEMIYLHLDNTSYYRGDRIHFACYLVTSGKLTPSNLSQTVYVELLNPGGKIIDRCTLKAVDGRCNGSLLADETPFYSGYYEIRAYTRYMLNFGAAAMYSRVIPIYATPKEEGNWAERTILKHDTKATPMLRPQTQSAKNIELKFYPEGGHLVSGLPSRVAFELTDAARRPLSDISGRIIDRSTDSVVATFSSGHMGRGAVDFTPAAIRYSAEVTVDGKRYWCDLPAVEPQGIALRVNSLPDSDSVEITVARTPSYSSSMIGVSLTCRGELYGRSIVDLSEQPLVSFKMSTASMPSGVAGITLFNASGQTIADRLFFHNRNDFVGIGYELDKAVYGPHEPVDMTVSSPAPFSLSVVDADNHVACGSNILTDLLLASEIKGYIHNPAYYFQPGKEAELDRLLMVQGWRRYSWNQLAGMEPIRLDSLPERGIEVRGRVLERYRDKPKAGISVSAMLSPLDSTNIFGSKAKAYTFTTDKNGRFMFRDSIYGKYMMIISSSNKHEISNNRILLDLSEHPAPRAYNSGEQQADIAVDTAAAAVEQVDTPESEPVISGTKLLREVEVTGKNDKAWEMAKYMENSIASYDVAEEVDAIRDNGKKHLRFLTDALTDMDKNFYHSGSELTYRGKMIFFISDPDFGSNKGVIDELIGMKDPVFPDAWSGINPGDIPIDYIKKIYINTQMEVISTYALRMLDKNDKTPMEIVTEEAPKYGCVVFLEYYPDKRPIMGKGVRKTTMEGYTPPIEFYSPDYSQEPPLEPDWRRTLYWNPDVRPDANGVARIRFYNNATATSFSVTATTITPSGTPGAIR